MSRTGGLVRLLGMLVSMVAAIAALAMWRHAARLAGRLDGGGPAG